MEDATWQHTFFVLLTAIRRFDIVPSYSFVTTQAENVCDDVHAGTVAKMRPDVNIDELEGLKENKSKNVNVH